jgi:hypothetical protein
MALSTTALRARVADEIRLFGAFSTAQTTSILASAASRYMDQVDRPRLSASLSVSSGVTTYAIPATIERVEDVRDADGASVLFGLDMISRQIGFQDAPSGSQTWTVYGTPADIRTNLDAVIAAVPENDEAILWEYVNAFAYHAAHSQDWTTQLQFADKLAFEKLKARNRSIEVGRATLRIIDSTGSLVASTDNAEGLTPGVSGDLGSDL